MGRGGSELASTTPGAASESGRDSLGDRMKGYEAEWKLTLPPRTLKIIRLDGRSFHTWTKGLGKPYSQKMLEAMKESTQRLMEEIPGAIIGYTQSDEISVLFGDFSSERSQPWFGGNAIKICSVAASIPAAVFAQRFPERSLAQFDARVFVVPSRVEAANALLWRQKDGQRNAISLLAQNLFSSRQLHGRSTADRKQMVENEGVKLADQDPEFLNGVMVVPHKVPKEVSYTPKGASEPTKVVVERTEVRSSAAERFSAGEGSWLLELIPEPPTEGSEGAESAPDRSA